MRMREKQNKQIKWFQEPFLLETMTDFERFLDEWLRNPQWWFNPKSCEYDAEITERFGHLLDSREPISQRDACGMVVAYDQVPRHVFRNSCANHVVLHFLKKALRILADVVDVEQLHGQELCFVLLPLRHSGNAGEAIRVVWERLQLGEGHGDVYRRFLKAAYERCPPLSRARLMDGPGCGFYDRCVLDPACLVERAAIAAKTDVELKEIFAKTVRTEDYYLVSLSGGLDSMVCSVMAAKVCSAVHVNYGNRATSDDEERFVQAWCAEKGMPLFVLKIDEIRRPLCMEHGLRETYEAYTKRLRLQAYRDAWGARPGIPRVILGHNKDDCFENVLTNIAHREQYENLGGMRPVSEQNGIAFFRPFLDVPKRALAEFAKDNGIPYVYDSTPKWSQRGKIRDNIVPVLEAWDAACVPGMFALAEHLTAMHRILDAYVEDALLRWVVRDDDKREISICGLHKIPTEVAVWRKLIEKLGLRQPSNRALRSCVRKKLSGGGSAKFHLSKALTVEVSESAMLFRF
jgi:tRNA(Ile)-lysidine synthetase-like protein